MGKLKKIKDALMKIQTHPPVGGIGHPRAKGLYRYVEGLKTPQASIGDDGIVYLNLPPSFKSWPEFAENRGFRYIDDLAWPYGEDEFIRVGGKNDAEYLKKGTHRGSKNWHTGEEEGGLSVARRLETFGESAKIVRGRVIGQGSDTEPLLDLKSVEVMRDVPPKFNDDQISALMQKYGISEEDALSIKLTHWQKGRIDPRLLAPVAAVGGAALAAQAYDFGTPDYDAAIQEFRNRRAQKSQIWKELKEAGATIASAIPASIVSDAYRIGGYLSPVTSLDETEQGAQAIQGAMTVAPTDDNRFLNEIGRQVDQLGRDIEPLVDAWQQTPIYKGYKQLPERAQRLIGTASEYLF